MVDQSGDAHAPHLLASLARLDDRIRIGMGPRAESSGLELRGSEARILDLIGPDGTRPTELAAGAWISKQAMTKRISGLQEKGLVRLEPDPVDGRAVLVHLTAAGTQRRDLALALVAGLERELAEAVGTERYQVFRAVLDELASPGPGARTIIEPD